MNSEMLINCQNIQKNYLLGNITVQALQGINLQVKCGEYMAILGPSGSGKSTLMNILGCLDSPTGGKYFLSKRDVSHLDKNSLAWVRNRQIGFIFQSFNLLAHLSALDNVALPLAYRRIPHKQRRKKALDLLTKVGLVDRINHMPNELSGGQRQRVAISRALITEPDIVLADEPTGNLDKQSGHDIIQMFEELSAQGKTIIIVTHDEILAKRTKRIIEICDGKIVSDDRTD